MSEKTRLVLRCFLVVFFLGIGIANYLRADLGTAIIFGIAAIAAAVGIALRGGKS